MINRRSTMEEDSMIFDTDGKVIGIQFENVHGTKTILYCGEEVDSYNSIFFFDDFIDC